MRLLHWLTALLVVVLFALGLWMRSLSYYDS
ncbi:MAG: cytochrome b, partial [Oceanisphaera sp.]